MKYVFLFLIFTVSACNGVRFNSSINPNVEESLKTHKVEEYSIAEIQRYQAKSLGQVTSSLCKTHPSQPTPTESLLLRDLKYKTQRIGGNGVVIMECVDHRINTSCNEFLECRALAYLVDF